MSKTTKWVLVIIAILVIIGIIIAYNKKKAKDAVTASVADSLIKRDINGSVLREKMCIGGTVHIWGIKGDGSGQYGWIPAFGRPACSSGAGLA